MNAFKKSKNKNASKIAGAFIGLAFLGLSIGDALNGHGILGNKNLNPIVVGDGSSSSSGSSNSSGSGGGLLDKICTSESSISNLVYKTCTLTKICGYDSTCISSSVCDFRVLSSYTCNYRCIKPPEPKFSFCKEGSSNIECDYDDCCLLKSEKILTYPTSVQCGIPD